jgi:hypothetical protein
VLGYIDYNGGGIRVHKSLLNAVLHDQLPEENASPAIRALCDDFERRSLSHAGIDDRCRAEKAEQCAKPHGLAFRKRVIAHLQPRRVSRHGSSLDSELWVLNQVVCFSMGGALRTVVKDILSQSMPRSLASNGPRLY